VLAPTQVVVLAVKPEARDVAHRIGRELAAQGVRAVVDDRTDVATFAGPGVAVAPPADHRPPGPDRVDELRSEVADLRVEVAELRHALDELRASLGG